MLWLGRATQSLEMHRDVRHHPLDTDGAFDRCKTVSMAEMHRDVRNHQHHPVLMDTASAVDGCATQPEEPSN